MRYVLLLTTALLVTACTTPDRIAYDSGHSATSARLSSGGGMPTMRAAPDLTRWTAYRTFQFGPTAVEISPSDLLKIREIVAYLGANPSLDVGIDGTAAGTNDAERSIGVRRAASVRRALMDTGVGVASYKIVTGTLADPERRHAGQVQVLVGPRTGSLSVGL